MKNKKNKQERGKKEGIIGNTQKKLKEHTCSICKIYRNHRHRPNELKTEWKYNRIQHPGVDFNKMVLKLKHNLRSRHLSRETQITVKISYL